MTVEEAVDKVIGFVLENNYSNNYLEPKLLLKEAGIPNELFFRVFDRMGELKLVHYNSYNDIRINDKGIEMYRNGGLSSKNERTSKWSVAKKILALFNF